MDYFSLQIHIPGDSTLASDMKGCISYRTETNYGKKETYFIGRSELELE